MHPSQSIYQNLAFLIHMRDSSMVAILSSTARLLRSAFALLMQCTSIVILYYVILFIVLAMDVPR